MDYCWFSAKGRQDSQNLYKDTFYETPVTSAQNIIRVNKYLDSAILLYYDDDVFS